MFVVVGIIGALLLLCFLLVGDALDGILPENDWVTGEVLGAFLAAFGLFGWVVDAQFDVGTPTAALVGVGGGLAMGWLALRLVRTLSRMQTDPTPGQRDLVGKQGRVVTAVSPGSAGEVLVTLAGQTIKLSAVADETLARGAAIVVVESQSPTRVLVQSAERFWGPMPEIDGP